MRVSRPLWIAAALILLLVLYVLSFGPACWWIAQPMPLRPTGRSGPVILLQGGPNTAPYVSRLYWPLGWLARKGPRPLSRAIIWYATVGTRATIALPTGPSGEARYHVRRPR